MSSQNQAICHCPVSTDVLVAAATLVEYGLKAAWDGSVFF